MIEALWTVEFASNLQMFGRGVVVFESERVFGGDASFYYLGDYKITNGEIKGCIEITNYGGVPSSVVGPGEKIRLNISGKLKLPIMELQGCRVDHPNIIISIRCTKRAELP